MGLQDKGCRQNDVKQKEMPKQAFSGNEKKDTKKKNIMPIRLSLSHRVEGHL